MPLQQNRIIQEAIFTYSPLREVLEKQIKTIKEKRNKQVKNLQSLDLNNQKKQPYQPQTTLTEGIFLKDQLNHEATDEIKTLLRTDQKITWEDLLYETGDTEKDRMYGFLKVKTT